MTMVHVTSEQMPAIRARAGVGSIVSHCGVVRSMVEWNTRAFSPAMIRKITLIRKYRLLKHLIGSDQNSSTPVLTIRKKPANVMGRNCHFTLETGSVRQSTPTSRRSYIITGAIIKASPNKCAPSNTGKTSVDSRIWVPIEVSCSHWQKLRRKDMRGPLIRTLQEPNTG